MPATIVDFKKSKLTFVPTEKNKDVLKFLLDNHYASTVSNIINTTMFEYFLAKNLYSKSKKAIEAQTVAVIPPQTPIVEPI